MLQRVRFDRLQLGHTRGQRWWSWLYEMRGLGDQCLSQTMRNVCVCIGQSGGGDGAGVGDRGIRGESGVCWANSCLVLLLVVSGTG